ncbi:MAG: Asp23/Gls24 family envelope stress response protein [Candidatus Dormibacteria bacterium]
MSPASAPRPPGRVRVASEVVASIAAVAALGTPGVAAMCEPLGVQVPRPLRGPHGHKGVRLEMIGTSAIKVELFVAITAQAAVPELAGELQGRVAQDLRTMLGLEVVEVNVHVVDVGAD